MKDKQKRRRERTWAEAARMVLENYSDAPMTPKQILKVIESEGLKETRSTGSSPLACLNAMLHSNSRTREALFYKLPGRISLFTMKKNALQWSRAVPLPPVSNNEGSAEAGNRWSEGNHATSAEETCANASCSREIHARETRSLVQINKQKRKSGVLLPRVVLTPLKVNGAHLPSTSGLSVHTAERESGGVTAAARSLTFHRRAALSRETVQHLRAIRSPGPEQVKKSKVEDIDFETPGSILVNTNLRALINLRTFGALPANRQQQLLLLLPDVDRQVGSDGQVRMSGSALNNEFFAHACQRWRERLSDGEFTPEMQLRIRQEMGKEKKIEDWKERFFEDFYGQKLRLTNELMLDQEDSGSRGAQLPVIQKRVPGTQPKDVFLPVVQGRSLRVKEGTREVPFATSTGREVSLQGSQMELPCSDAEPSAACSQSLAIQSDQVSEPHRHISEQKRKTSEMEPLSPSIEKKTRTEQRRSFRNTIQSVYTAKPQPTKEEPKVPPIRIQLSRIKPPWLDKGLSSYQIYPRIIPNSDPTGVWTTSCSPPNSQASDIGGGGGPGGGGINRKRRKSRNPKVRRYTKRRFGKPFASCCRTQLLPSAALSNKVNTITEKWGFTLERPDWNRDSSASAVDASDVSVNTNHGHLYGIQAFNSERLGPRLISQTVFESSVSIQGGGQIIAAKDGTNQQLILKEKKSVHYCEAVDTEGSNGRAVHTLALVLGDALNTFQNRNKKLTAKRKSPVIKWNSSGRLSFPPLKHREASHITHTCLSYENVSASKIGVEVELHGVSCASKRALKGSSEKPLNSNWSSGITLPLTGMQQLCNGSNLPIEKSCAALSSRKPLATLDNLFFKTVPEPSAWLDHVCSGAGNVSETSGVCPSVSVTAEPFVEFRDSSSAQGDEQADSREPGEDACHCPSVFCSEKIQRYGPAWCYPDLTKFLHVAQIPGASKNQSVCSFMLHDL
ncbi:hypothetical protein GDO86_014641 [Hymenochirus boettgeri]|uniref:Polycomb group protein ASXL1 n=1 Tax=Hymenochirus boettgeri TaxID=247094 RepID=A0A8T2JXV3_9PIPI|nr:hypothetical protein GDO86_014641 [Hymenochirus boettgeri]